MRVRVIAATKKCRITREIHFQSPSKTSPPPKMSKRTRPSFHHRLRPWASLAIAGLILAFLTPQIVLCQGKPKATRNFIHSVLDAMKTSEQLEKKYQFRSMQTVQTRVRKISMFLYLFCDYREGQDAGAQVFCFCYFVIYNYKNPWLSVNSNCMDPYTSSI